MSVTNVSRFVQYARKQSICFVFLCLLTQEILRAKKKNLSSFTTAFYFSVPCSHLNTWRTKLSLLNKIELITQLYTKKTNSVCKYDFNFNRFNSKKNFLPLAWNCVRKFTAPLPKYVGVFIYKTEHLKVTVFIVNSLIGEDGQIFRLLTEIRIS